MKRKIQALKRCFVTSLKVLGFNAEECKKNHGIELTEDVFDSVNVKAALVFFHFLLETLDPERAKQDFRDCWPLTDIRSQGNALKKVICGRLTELQQKQKCLFLNAGTKGSLERSGEFMYYLLVKLSLHVMERVLQRDYGIVVALPKADITQNKEEIAKHSRLYLRGKNEEVASLASAAATCEEHWMEQVSRLADALHQLQAREVKADEELREMEVAHPSVCSDPQAALSELRKSSASRRHVLDQALSRHADSGPKQAMVQDVLTQPALGATLQVRPIGFDSLRASAPEGSHASAARMKNPVDLVSIATNIAKQILEKNATMRAVSSPEAESAYLSSRLAEHSALQRPVEDLCAELAAMRTDLADSTRQLAAREKAQKGPRGASTLMMTPRQRQHHRLIPPTPAPSSSLLFDTDEDESESTEDFADRRSGGMAPTTPMLSDRIAKSAKKKVNPTAATAPSTATASRSALLQQAADDVQPVQLNFSSLPPVTPVAERTRSATMPKSALKRREPSTAQKSVAFASHPIISSFSSFDPDSPDPPPSRVGGGPSHPHKSSDLFGALDFAAPRPTPAWEEPSSAGTTAARSQQGNNKRGAEPVLLSPNLVPKKKLDSKMSPATRKAQEKAAREGHAKQAPPAPVRTQSSESIRQPFVMDDTLWQPTADSDRAYSDYVDQMLSSGAELSLDELDDGFKPRRLLPSTPVVPKPAWGDAPDPHRQPTSRHEDDMPTTPAPPPPDYEFHISQSPLIQLDFDDAS